MDGAKSHYLCCAIHFYITMFCRRTNSPKNKNKVAVRSTVGREPGVSGTDTSVELLTNRPVINQASWFANWQIGWQASIVAIMSVV